jgi:UDP-glucose 4-epimerase
VPCCEQNPIEALKTNVLGSNNVLEASIKNEVKKVVCISTDKAVNPSSVMGLTKLYMEKLALSKAKE